MSTDWTTNNNTKFGNEEVYLKLSDSLAKIGLIEVDENNTIDSKRNVFYNLFKRHGLCSGNGNWDLYDRYDTSNNYTNNKLDDVIVLSAANDVNIKYNNVLFSNDNSQASINERKNYIMDELSKYQINGLCNTIQDLEFFPHLDVVTDVEIRSLNGEDTIVCYELSSTIFYGIIKYTDSCHIDSDPLKCLEPVPYYNDIKYEVSTYHDKNKIPSSAKFKWDVVDSKLGTIEDLTLTGDTTWYSPYINCAVSKLSIASEVQLFLEYKE